CVRCGQRERKVCAQQLQLDFEPLGRADGRRVAQCTFGSDVVPLCEGEDDRRHDAPTWGQSLRNVLCTSDIAERKAEVSLELVGIGEQTRVLALERGTGCWK